MKREMYSGALGFEFTNVSSACEVSTRSSQLKVTAHFDDGSF